MLEKIKNLFLYSGVDNHSYERVKNTILNANRIMTTTLSAFASILIASMLIFSMNARAVSQNKNVYGLGLVISLLVFVLSITIAKKNKNLITILVHASYSIYYIYGILIGTITDPGEKTVTFMVLLVFLPVLFIDRPIHTIWVSTIYVIIFLILCFMKKTGAVLANDVADAIIFGLLGVASGTIINHMKVRGYVLESKLKEISRIDQLTQIKNRNAYELEYDSIPQECKYSLACLYIDANGLHEINNSEGHEYGDKMLKYIAVEVKNAFSEKFTYRTGGDEFIAFILDTSSEEIEPMISEMIKKIEEKGYHVAIGYDVAKIKHLSLDELIKSAESKMFKDKKRYYKDIANREIRN